MKHKISAALASFYVPYAISFFFLSKNDSKDSNKHNISAVKLGFLIQNNLKKSRPVFKADFNIRDCF